MEDTLTFAEFHERFLELVRLDGELPAAVSTEQAMETFRRYNSLSKRKVQMDSESHKIIQELKDEIAELKADIECYKAMDRI